MMGKVKTFKNLNLQDRIAVPTKRKITDSGQMIVPCAIARTGNLIYKGSSIGLVDQAEELIEVYRREEDVFSEDSMNSFRSAPVTIGHPKDKEGNQLTVDSTNAKELQVGMLEGMPVRDEDLLTGTLVITNQEAIDAIEEGTVELSAGYTCDIHEDNGKYYQTNIKANHIAIVDKGRAGSSCSIADEAVEESEASKAEIKDLTEVVEDVITEDVTTEDVITEAEAAEAVALHEENETLMAEDNVTWAKEYADNAEVMAKAHAEVAKYARKIANKKAKVTTDSSDSMDSSTFINDVNIILKEVENLNKELQDTKESINDIALERCDVIMFAKEITDLKDFSGKNVRMIKELVISDVLGMETESLTNKTKEYIDARFDILSEDMDSETPMSILLNKQIEDVVIPKDIVKDARQNMINRNKGK